jgi:hypothetical protein
MELTMQTNLNDYDNRPSWTPPQSQPYTSQFATPYDGRQPLPRQQNQAQRPVNQKPKAPEKMPKAQAMALANKFKRGLAITSILGFGVFGGLVALHQIGSTTTQSSQNSSNSSSSQDSNNFLNQQGGNTNGTSSSSSTVTGTRTS